MAMQGSNLFCPPYVVEMKGLPWVFVQLPQVCDALSCNSWRYAVLWHAAGINTMNVRWQQQQQ